MKLLRDKTIKRGKVFTKLRYTVLIPASSFSSVYMFPFKRHFSAVDEFYSQQISFGNILGHNQLYVKRKISVSDEVANILKVNRSYLPRLALPKAAPIQITKQTKSVSLDSGKGSLSNGQNIDQVFYLIFTFRFCGYSMVSANIITIIVYF
jgi:hypothetical protein